MRKTDVFAAGGRLLRGACVTRVSCWWPYSRKQSCWRRANFFRCGSFIYAGYSPGESANVCVCVFVHWREVRAYVCVWSEWVVEQKKKTCLSRSSVLSMDLSFSRHDLKKKHPPHQTQMASPDWCMTCSLQTPGETVLIGAEMLFCYCCFNIRVTLFVHEWEWASCQPQCPLSQFHCPCCDHMGAPWHLSTLFGTKRNQQSTVTNSTT